MALGNNDKAVVVIMPRRVCDSDSYIMMELVVTQDFPVWPAWNPCSTGITQWQKHRACPIKYFFLAPGSLPTSCLHEHQSYHESEQFSKTKQYCYFNLDKIN